MNWYIGIVCAALAAYLLGSVPFALVIGKVFYHTDVRQHGSKNLGGGNTGRVLGKKAGVAVMTMDILKVVFALGIAAWIAGAVKGAAADLDAVQGIAALVGTDPEQGRNLFLAVAGLFAAIGHCFPVFAKFKGGKAVAALYGFWLGTALWGGYSLLLFILPLLLFLVILYLWKIIALASIFSALISTAFVYFFTGSWVLTVTSAAYAILVVVRHHKNLDRIRKGVENKISWM